MVGCLRNQAAKWYHNQAAKWYFVLHEVHHDDQLGPSKTSAMIVSRDRWSGSLLQRALHVAVLSTFAFAMPLLDLLGRQATFFVAHRSRPADLLALVLLLVIAAPSLLIAIEMAADRVSRRAGRAVHFLLLSLLSAAALLSVVRKVERVPVDALLAAAVILGLGIAVLAARTEAMRTFLTFLSPVLLVCPASFLFLSPAKKLLVSDHQAITAPKIPATTPVVMVVFDEIALPYLMDESLTIDAVLYPNFASLAQHSHWFRNATTVAQSTRFAVPAILTGNYPDADRLPIFRDYRRNLFSLLSGSYELRVFEALTNLCPPGFRAERFAVSDRSWPFKNLLLDAMIVYPHVLLPADLTTGLPSIADTWANFRERTERRREGQVKAPSFVETLRSGEASTLYFNHSLLPHGPAKYLPSGKTYDGHGVRFFGRGLFRGKWSDEWRVLQAFQRYLLQLRYVDKVVGEMLGALRESGIYDRSLIVVTSDHGVSYRPRGYRRRVTKENFHEILPVPLFIKLPGQRQAFVNDQNVETIDILPTIAQELGLEELPWPIEGRPLFDPDFEPRPNKVVYKSGRLRGEPETFEPRLLDHTIEAVTRTISLFGSGADPRAIFRFGPRPELIGKPVSEIEAAGSPRTDVLIFGSQSYDEVDLEGSFLPARLSGQLLTETRDTPRILAIGINGTVRAVTWTFETKSRPRCFTAMVPEDSFVSGRNIIKVLDVTDAAGLELGVRP